MPPCGYGLGQGCGGSKGRRLGDLGGRLSLEVLKYPLSTLNTTGPLNPLKSPKPETLNPKPPKPSAHARKGITELLLLATRSLGYGVWGLGLRV